MPKNRAAIIGYGNIGKFALEAINASPDFELGGIVELAQSDSGTAARHLGVPIVQDIEELTGIKVALLCLPSRLVPQAAARFLSLGINTVDGFDIHTEVADYQNKIRAAAQNNNAVAIISAGWDPGTDSMFRCIFDFMAPRGITYTNFGPGMSMGHSVAARDIPGVIDALAITIPQGSGIHKRLLYIEVKAGYDFAKIAADIKADSYFASDDTTIIKVDDVRSLIDMGHGVSMERKGVSGLTHNQLLNFNMRINNPALTAQIMVAAARASLRQKPGVYTVIEIPIIDFMPGEREAIIRKYV